MIRRIRAVIRKEVRQILRDRRSLGVILFIPVFLLVMFGYAVSLDVRHIALGVLDRDQSPESRSLIRRFQNNEYFDLKAYPVDERQAGELLDRGVITAALIIPADFTRKRWREGTLSLQVILDGSNPTVASTALGYFEVIVERHAGDLSLAAFLRAGRGTVPLPVDFRPRVWYNPELSSSMFLMPGLITFILVITAVVSTSLSIVREKERGTMEQLLVSPLRPLELVVGKTAPYVLISFLSALGVLFVSHLLFGVSVAGSYLALLLVMGLFLLACLGLGLLISTVSASQQVAFTLAVLATVLPSFLLSGFVYPIRNMPRIIQAFTYLIPARYVLVALRGIMIKGSGPRSFWPELLDLAVFAAASLGLSVLRLRASRAPGVRRVKGRG